MPKSYDGYKKVNGRKRHIIVDTLGLVLVVLAHAANQHDSPAARAVLTRLANLGDERVNKILVDSPDGKKLACWLKKLYGLILEVEGELVGFRQGRLAVMPKR